MDSTRDKLNKINGLCSTIISLSNFYNDEKECCVDYDKIIDKLESIINYEFKKRDN